MHLSKLTVALKAFNEPQFKRLREYAHSPYFKVPCASVALLDYLSAHYPSFPEKKIQPALIARKVTNLPTASCQSWAATELLHAIEHFIGLEHQRANPSSTVLHQLQGSRELGLFQHFHKDYSSAVQRLDQCPEQHTDTFYHRHLFTELQFNQRDVMRKENAPSDIIPAVASLDEFYALKKLHYLLEAHVRNQVSEKVFPAKQISALLKTLQPYNNPKYPGVYLFVNIYRLLSAQDIRQSIPYYIKLKDYAAQKLQTPNSKPETLPPPALSEGIGYIVHYCLNWYNKGIEEAGKEYLWWVEIKMKYGWLLETEKLNPVTFRNILQVAVKHKSADWMAQFTAACEPYLSEEHRETNLCFARGLLSYRKKDYKEAVRFFAMAQASEQPLLNCLIRRWQWMCGYECSCRDKEALENQLLCFEKYLNRNKKELGHYKIAFDKFIHYATTLWSVKTPAIQLQKEEYFPGKHWLVNQYHKRQTTQLKKEAVEA